MSIQRQTNSTVAKGENLDRMQPTMPMTDNGNAPHSEDEDLKSIENEIAKPADRQENRDCDGNVEGENASQTINFADNTDHSFSAAATDASPATDSTATPPTTDTTDTSPAAAATATPPATDSTDPIDSRSRAIYTQEDLDRLTQEAYLRGRNEAVEARMASDSRMRRKDKTLTTTFAPYIIGRPSVWK